MSEKTCQCIGIRIQLDGPLPVRCARCYLPFTAESTPRHPLVAALEARFAAEQARANREADRAAEMEAQANREQARADAAERELARVTDDLRGVVKLRDAAIARAEKAEAALDEVESELGCIKEAITQHLPCYVSENDEDDECDAVDTIEEAGRELARLKATVGSHVSAGTYAKRVDERDEARAALALAERARDEVGIQLAAAQAEIARLRKAVADVRVLRDVGVMPDRVARALDQVFVALDTVPGDALAAVVTDEAVKVGCDKWSHGRITAALEASGIDTNNVKGGE